MVQFDAKRRWDWGATIGYDLPCTANNIELQYFHLRSDCILNEDQANSPSSVAAYPFTNLILVLGDFANFTPPAEFAHNFTQHCKLRYHLDSWDLKFGRNYIDTCHQFKFHPSVGVRLANFKKTVNATINTGLTQEGLGLAFSNPELIDFDADSQIDTFFKSTYHGAGPMASVDLRYSIFGNIGLVGHFDTSLLVGKIEDQANYFQTLAPTNNIPTVLPSGVYVNEFFKVPSKERLVPTLTGSIGLDYGYCFCNKSSLTVEVGYTASRYFNLIQEIRGDVALPPFVFTGNLVPGQHRITAVDNRDFDYKGPYINVTWHL